MKKILALSLVALMPTLAIAKKAPAAPAKTVLNISTADTKLKWEGKKVTGAHQGEIKVKSGTLEVAKEQLVGGEVVIDMTTISNNDLSDGSMKEKLLGHLKSDDFFSVEKNPTATLTIKKVTKKKDDQFTVSGDLVIKGISKPVTFPATIHASNDMVHATGTITVDRTAYGIKYNSLKFFSSIADKAINDNFTVDVEVVAKK